MALAGNQWGRIGVFKRSLSWWGSIFYFLSFIRRIDSLNRAHLDDWFWTYPLRISVLIKNPGILRSWPHHSWLNREGSSGLNLMMELLLNWSHPWVLGRWICKSLICLRLDDLWDHVVCWRGLMWYWVSWRYIFGDFFSLYGHRFSFFLFFWMILAIRSPQKLTEEGMWLTMA